jgi:transglycosylase-like protein
VRTFVAWTLAATAVAAPSAALARPAVSRAADEPPIVSRAANLIGQIDHWRNRTWYWQRVMGQQRWPTGYLERKTGDLDFREWSLKLWRGRALRARRSALHPPNHQGWLCIYRYERNPAQGWHTYTGNGFYGGLQMDLGFQQHYGAWLLRKKGPAHRWTPIEQIWVAERGRRVQGWYAWPHTARACGLI